MRRNKAGVTARPDRRCAAKIEHWMARLRTSRVRGQFGLQLNSGRSGSYPSNYIGFTAEAQRRIGFVVAILDLVVVVCNRWSCQSRSWV